jgi:hypothetical protein
MPKPRMADAMRASLSSEQDAISKRFERAESVLALRGGAGEGTPPSPPTAEEPNAGPVTKKRKTREPRPKVVHRTFSLTADEYRLIWEIKRRCNLEGFEAAQSEVVRVGLHLLSRLSSPQLREAFDAIVRLKRGRTPPED